MTETETRIHGRYGESMEIITNHGMTDKGGEIYFSLRDGFEYVNIIVPVEDLVDALNKHPGFTVTYEEPKPEVKLPTGFGAIVKLYASQDHRAVRVGEDEWRTSYPGGSRSTEWKDTDVLYHLTNGTATVESEGLWE